MSEGSGQLAPRTLAAHGPWRRGPSGPVQLLAFLSHYRQPWRPPSCEVRLYARGVGLSLFRMWQRGHDNSGGQQQRQRRCLSSSPTAAQPSLCARAQVLSACKIVPTEAATSTDGRNVLDFRTVDDLQGRSAVDWLTDSGRRRSPDKQ